MVNEGIANPAPHKEKNEGSIPIIPPPTLNKTREEELDSSESGEHKKSGDVPQMMLH